jgi:hypothetical protein
MRLKRQAILLAGALSAVVAGNADAYICYLLLNPSNVVIYRATLPPVDMSARGAAERDALRQRGEYLLIIDTNDCAPEGAALGSADKGTLADYVSGIKPVLASGEGGGTPRAMPASAAAPGGAGGAPAGNAPPGAGGTAPATAPRAPARGN